MKEHPILFSGPMVRAILEGRKTVTRRVVKEELPAKTDATKRSPYGFYRDRDTGLFKVLGSVQFVRQTNERVANRGLKAPYEVGDRLWVRETWQPHPEAGVRFPEGSIPADAVVYAADLTKEEYNDSKPWKPSIYMPRAASRITLEVVGVRAERLKEITNEDALKEGIESDDYLERIEFQEIAAPVEGLPTTYLTPRTEFKRIWDSINGKKHPWDSNPWVWRVEFKVLEAAED